MRYAFIEGHRGMCRLPVMCRVLAVSKSGYFAWRDGRERPCVSGDRALSVRIKAIHEESRQTYGSRGSTMHSRPKAPQSHRTICASHSA